MLSIENSPVAKVRINILKIQVTVHRVDAKSVIIKSPVYSLEPRINQKVFEDTNDY